MKKKRLMLLFLAFCLGLVQPASAAVQEMAPSTRTTHVLLYIDRTEAFLNSKQVKLDAPATIIDGKMFVPAKFLADVMGTKMEWNGETRQILMETPGYSIVLDSDNQLVWINGLPTPFNEVASISKNGRLLIKLTWLADYMGAQYTYNNELRRVEVIHMPVPKSIYDPNNNNSKPVAKFSVNKTKYRIGEPIKYVDLSYDPDAEGLVKYNWKGRQETFFQAGTYPVSLSVVDKSGNESEVYTRHIVVTNEVFLNTLEYPIYIKPVGSFFKTDWSTLYANFWDLPQIPKLEVKEDTSRKLLVSDSPEEFKEEGILYQDQVEGKARLYADHINGTSEKVTFAILVRNITDNPVTIKTTNRGEVWPSVYAHLIGSEATVDFLMKDEVEEALTIPANKTYIYAQFPDFYPGQGVNLFYDIETDGKIEVSFIATHELSNDSLTELPLLPFSGHVRGTFPVSQVDWTLDGASVTQPARLIIGDGVNDPFQPGYDPMRGENVLNNGNYGVVYNMHIQKPRKMAVMVLAKGGYYKGPFKVNGEMIPVPVSGVLTAFDGMNIIARTEGNESSLDIQFSPPAGSAFPIELIFYPLADKK